MVSKKYRERKRMQNQELDNRIFEMENENLYLKKKLDDMYTVRLFLGFELLKNIFLKNNDDNKPKKEEVSQENPSEHC